MQMLVLKQYTFTVSMFRWFRSAWEQSKLLLVSVLRTSRLHGLSSVCLRESMQECDIAQGKAEFAEPTNLLPCYYYDQ
jgi:hypothetical protein